MSEELEVGQSEMAFISYLNDQVSLLKTFALAVARSHPDPQRLLSEFEKSIAEDEEGELPYSELTPDNRVARNHYRIHRDMLIRVIKSRTS